ncbi:MAG: Glycosyltransferase AglE [Methanocella sp. PtaU1.Bin125]|nr:MAG: Glycosyltransferase AglE [Methanocella sp. PtaU1.Bin125]
MPLVSVIMTSYNYGRYIAQAIESVLYQTFTDFELIVIDDGSTDDSRAIIKRYADRDPRVRYVFHGANAGIAGTNNEGIRLSAGKYIAFVDSDDLWVRDKLERQVDVLRKDEDLVVWSEGEIIDMHGEPLRTKARGGGRPEAAGEPDRRDRLTFTRLFGAGGKKKSGDIFRGLLQNNFILGSGMMFKKDLLGDISFNPDLKYLNDYLFNLDLARKCRFHFISEPLIKYRLHGNNSSLRDKRGWDRDWLKFNRLVIERYGADIPGRLMSRLLCFNGMIYARMGRVGTALGCLFRGIALYPLHVYYLLFLCYQVANNAYRGDSPVDSSAAAT